MPVEQITLKTITVTLQFQSIDTDECVLDCDGGCSYQAEWIAFTNDVDPHSPAFALCHGCLVKLERYVKTRPASCL